MRKLALVLVVLMAGAPLAAIAHATLDKANPGAGENLSASPAKVELRFSEPLEPAFSGISVTDTSGHDVAAGSASVSGNTLSLPLKNLAPGRYRVMWYAVSLDTHRSEGKFNFAILAPAAPQLTVTYPWFRALPGGLPAGGYFDLHNATSKAVTLTGASSPACGMLMLHKSDMMSGMASMSDVSTIDVPAGGTLSFSPGGYHLMCMNPTSAMQRGSKVTVMLEFAGGMKLPVAFDVRGANGK